jgi:putative sigma-54 modulation protein
LWDGERKIQFARARLSFHTQIELQESSVQVNVSARHGHLKSEDQEIITTKVEKLRRFFDRINAIEVTVDLERLDRPSVEINVSAEHAPDFVAATESSSVVSALDLTIDKVEQQIRKHKERVTDHKGGPTPRHS